MAYEIKLEPVCQTFSCYENETLLQAASRHGISLKQGCAVGACRACKARVVSGNVTYPPQFRNALTPEEIASGHALLCCALPGSDLTIEAAQTANAPDSVQEFPGVVETIQRSGNITLCHLRLPRRLKLSARPGQYVQVIWRDGRCRAFSIANQPHEDGVIEFHIRCRPGGAFSDYAAMDMRIDDVLRMRGPFGEFSLNADSQKPILFVATGTGFAPVQALIDKLVREGSRRPISLYWGGRAQADLYFRERIEQWQRSPIDFRFVPVLSRPPASGWDGRTGYVGSAMQNDISDFSPYEAYVCGAPAMVEDTFRHMTCDGGMPVSAFHADAFHCASVPASAVRPNVL